MVSEDNNLTIVAVDKDKHSTHAVRWAINNLFESNRKLVLIHVRTTRRRYPSLLDTYFLFLFSSLFLQRLILCIVCNLLAEAGHSVTVEPHGGSVDDIFCHFRAYCARKAVRHRFQLLFYTDKSLQICVLKFAVSCYVQTIVHEEIIEGNDVHTALVDYINKHHVTTIVLGASSRNPLTRYQFPISLYLSLSISEFGRCRFWTYDVPMMINKAAPDFCSVYVIARGKPQSIRPAAREDAYSIAPRLPEDASRYPTLLCCTSDLYYTNKHLSP